MRVPRFLVRFAGADDAGWNHHNAILRGLLLFAVGILITVPNVPLHSASSAGAPVFGGPTVAASPSSPDVATPALSPNVTLPLVVNSTLNLPNSTLFPGNYTPPDASSPTTLVYDSARHVVYGGGSGNQSVVLINTSTDLAQSSLEVNNTTLALAYDPGQSEIIASKVACTYMILSYCLVHTYSIVTISDLSNEVTGTISIGAGATGLAYDPAHGTIWAVIPRMNRTLVINDTTDSVVWNVTVGTAPDAVAIDGQDGEAFVANGGSANLSVISTSTGAIVANPAVGTHPVAVTYDPAAQEVFVANNDSDNVSVLSAPSRAPVASLALEQSPRTLAYDPILHEVFVGASNQSGVGNVSAIADSNDTIVASVAAFGMLYASAFDPDNGRVFFANVYAGNVQVYSDAPVASVAVVLFFESPSYLAFDTGRNEVFSTDYTSGFVDVISGATRSVIARVNVGDASGEIVYDSGRGEVFVANQFWNNLSVISDTTNTVVANVSLPDGSTPYGLAYDAARGEIFVADSDNGTVSVVNDTTNAVVASVPVGSQPLELAYDPIQGEVFVANSNSHFLSVISDSSNTVVKSVHLGVDLNGTSVVYDSNRGQIFAFAANNGVGPDNLVAVSGATGNIVARVGIPWGTNLGTLAYDPQVGEILLSASPTDWGGVIAVSDRDYRIVQWLPTATSVIGGAGIGPVGMTYDPISRVLYVANYWYGTLSLVTEATLTFRERGLDPFVDWSISAAPFLGTQFNTTDNRSGEISFDVPAGPFTFVIDPPSDCFCGVARISGPSVVNQSTVIVSGPTQVLVVFSWLAVLTFNASAPSASWPGLLPGTPWGVTITPALPGGPPAQTAMTVAGSGLNFTVPAGAIYRFQIIVPAIYRASPGHGHVTSPWFGKSISVKFRPVTAAVTFVETGLPSGTLWAVNLTGPLNVSLNSTGVALRFRLVNGTYHYEIWNLSSLHPHPITGTFVVTVPESPQRFVVVYNSTP